MVKILCLDINKNIINIHKIDKFHSGEQRIPFDNYLKYEYLEVQCFYDSDSDLFFLYLFGEHLKRIDYCGILNLFIPYMPYSRMDRFNEKEFEQFELLVTYLKSLFDNITTMDLHNPLTGSVFNTISSNHLFTTLTETMVEYDAVVYPDKTAYFRRPDNSKNFICIDKIRTEHNVVSKIVFDSLNLHNKEEEVRFLIVDDICSMGRTFINAAKLIKEEYPNAIIDLLVSHAENGIYLGELFDHINIVYTTDSILSKPIPPNLVDRIILLEEFRTTDKVI